MRYNGLFQDAATPLVLENKGDVTVTFSANNGVILKMAITVRNSADKDLQSVGVAKGSARLSSAKDKSGNANNKFLFSAEKLVDPAYVKWMIWAEYPDAITFDATVTVTQNGTSNDSIKQYQLAGGILTESLEEDGDFLDIAAAPPAATVKPKAAAKAAPVLAKGGVK